MENYNYAAVITRIVELYQEKLNDWEIEFISNVYDWHVLKNGKLSEKQKQNVKKINSKMLGR